MSPKPAVPAAPAKPAVPPMPPTPAAGMPAAKPVSASTGAIPPALDEEETTPLPPGSPEASPIQTATMADLFVSQGHPEKAVPIYQKLLQANPTDGELIRKLTDAARAAAAAEASAPPALAADGDGGGSREALHQTLEKVRSRRRAPSAHPALAGKEP